MKEEEFIEIILKIKEKNIEDYNQLVDLIKKLTSEY